MGDVIYLTPRPIGEIAKEVVADLCARVGHQDGQPDVCHEPSSCSVKPTDLRAIATADKPASSRR